MKDINEINKEIRENKNPLTKEEAKQHFVAMTNKLDLKHTFDFDEAYDTALELRGRKEFRENITTLEEQIADIDGALIGEDLHRANPVKHTFADGCYIREIFNPAGLLLVTKIHKKKHPFFLMKGEMSILTENGVEHVKAPHHGITHPGTKRIIYTHEDCVFITVHATESTDIKKIEEAVIAKDFKDPDITLEDIRLLKNSKLIKNKEL